MCRWGCTVWDMLVCGMAMCDGVGLSEEIGHEGGLCRFGGRGDGVNGKRLVWAGYWALTLA